MSMEPNLSVSVSVSLSLCLCLPLSLCLSLSVSLSLSVCLSLCAREFKQQKISRNEQIQMVARSSETPGHVVTIRREDRQNSVTAATYRLHVQPV